MGKSKFILSRKRQGSELAWKTVSVEKIPSLEIRVREEVESKTITEHISWKMKKINYDRRNRKRTKRCQS